MDDRDDDQRVPVTAVSSGEVEAFLRAVAAVPPPSIQGGRRGRLLFGMDATASREPTWDRACRIQGEMFDATAGALDVQLVYYRGFNECRASPWAGNARALLRVMMAVRCAAGQTQIGRVLRHAVKQTGERKVDAVVFVGDCFEEDLDRVAHAAGELGLLGVPVFVFHEGGDIGARDAFRTIAHLSGGACCPFDASSARQLAELLRAVAVYAAGGRPALEAHGRTAGEAVKALTRQMAPGGR
jgi:hypothetical protein